jgi:molecular chaperone DnaK (HSP70)
MESLRSRIYEIKKRGKTPVVIGIDFGTTRTVVARANERTATVLSFGTSLFLNSTVAVSQNPSTGNLTYHVGQNMVNFSEPFVMFSQLKRLRGRR